MQRRWQRPVLVDTGERVRTRFEDQHGLAGGRERVRRRPAARPAPDDADVEVREPRVPEHVVLGSHQHRPSSGWVVATMNCCT